MIKPLLYKNLCFKDSVWVYLIFFINISCQVYNWSKDRIGDIESESGGKLDAINDKA